MANSFGDGVIDFVWACWGAVGVPAPVRRPIATAVDVEPLIHVTNEIGSRDRRLAAHAQAWQQSFPELVSRTRLKRLGGDPDVASVLPDRSKRIAGPAHLDVTSAAAVQLRVRSALGVSARAEIIRQLGLDPVGTTRSASDLAQLCGYSKRNVEKSLAGLERAGWVMRMRGGASLRWSLADHAAIAELFSPMPESNLSFLALCRILEALLPLDRYLSEDRHVRSAAARRVLDEQGPTAEWGSVRLPAPPPGGDAWEEALAWVDGLVESAL